MTRPRENGFSLIELLIAVAIILIIAAIAIPSLMHSRMAANEASAVGLLHAINTACANFSASYDGSYPDSLADLGPSSTPSSTAADLLDSVLSSGIKSGYIFSFTPGPAGPSGLISSYTVTADPITPGGTGQRGFYTDQSFVIRVNVSGTASSSDSPIS